MAYTVKELADLAGVSVRTLHYYDEIGLLNPAGIAKNGYRYYEGVQLFRLQQILLYKELGLGLRKIVEILDRPDFDPVQTLEEHRTALSAEIKRLQVLINTVDRTISTIKGEHKMGSDGMFTGFSKEQEEEYKQRAVGRWGEEQVSASYDRWDSYSEDQKQKILDEGNAVYTELVECIPNGAESSEAQAAIARWHHNLRYFYEPSTDRMRGLGEMYVQHPEFAARFRKMHPDLPEFLRTAIATYCDDLD